MSLDAPPYSILKVMREAIFHDYLMFILITSQSQAKLQNKGWQFGVGKTALAFSLAWQIYRDLVKDDNHQGYFKVPEGFNPDNYAYELVFKHLGYTSFDLETVLLSKYKMPVYVLDDFEADMGRDKSNDKYLESLAGRLNTARDNVGVVIGTAPSIMSIASPFRHLFKFELIVPERGRYEIQKVIYMKDYKNPYRDRIRLYYQAEGRFPDYVPWVKERYLKWRAMKKDELSLRASAIDLYKLDQVLQEPDVQLLSHLRDVGRLGDRQIYRKGMSPSLRKGLSFGVIVKAPDGSFALSEKGRLYLDRAKA